MIKIQGHSNFIVKIVKISDIYYIRKACCVNDNNNNNDNDKIRLLKQIEKQNYLYNNNFLKDLNIKVPQIIEKFSDFKNSVFIMEYISFSQNIIDFIQRDNIIKINWFTNILIKIVESYISKCQMTYISRPILQNKINSIFQNLKNNKNIYSGLDFDLKFEYKHKLKNIFTYLNDNIDFICSVKIPIGICHGDLTFSNILIDNNTMNLYLIDFLDSFIESPLIDIVKLRQDSKLLWTLNLYKYNYDKNKVVIMFDYIDNKIDKYFTKYDFYSKLYNFFEIINILRILQYAKDKNIISNLFDNLIKCFI